MYKFDINLRVRYSETDRMGYCYYGNYAHFFEVARVESLRNLGITYKKMENNGILLPVIEFNIKYLKPAFYDDFLTISTYINEIPSTRIKFEYETYNEKKEKINFATTSLVFVNKNSGKPLKAPDQLIEKLKAYIK